MKSGQPSELEVQILSVLWQRGPCTVREVLDAIPDGKRRAYTTVLSTMQVMDKKKLVTRSSRGITHIYKPAVSESKVLGGMLSDLVIKAFGGRPSQVMQHLLDQTKISDGELAEIDRLLEAARDKRRKGK